MTRLASKGHRWVKRHQDMVRVTIWITLLVTLLIGGCTTSNSSTIRCSSAGIQLTGHEPRYVRSASSAELVEVSSSFDMAFTDTATCQRLADGLVRQGFVAIKIPDATSVGAISRNPTYAPYLDLYPFDNPEDRTRVPLNFADDLVDDIASVLPIGQSEAAHWEVMAYSGEQMFDCNPRSGELHYAIEYSGAICEGCELETAVGATGALTGFPFQVSGQTHILARFRGLVKVDPEYTPPLMFMGQYSKWINAADNPAMAHPVCNNTMTDYTVDLSYRSSRGQTWMFCSDWQCNQPVTSLEVPFRGCSTLYVKRAGPPTFDGFETLEITAVAREDPSARASVIDSYGIAEDWTEPYEFKLYVPALSKR